jgi:hypothetical protein
LSSAFVGQVSNESRNVFACRVDLARAVVNAIGGGSDDDVEAA